MKKRLPTSIFILIVTIGFVLLRQFSILLFDAFAFIIMTGSIIEIIKIHKKENKKLDSFILLLIPIFEIVVFNLLTGKTLLLSFVGLIILMLVYLLSLEIVSYGINRKNVTEDDSEEIRQHLFDRTKNTLLVFAYPILPLSFMFVLNHLGYQLGYISIVLIFANILFPSFIS